MNLEKLNHITYNSAEEAVMVAKFLKSRGFKLKKKYFDKSFYKMNYPYGFPFEQTRKLLYDSFTRVDKEWRASSRNLAIFTYSINGKSLIRREKLNVINQVSDADES